MTVSAEGRVENQKLNQTAPLGVVWLGFWFSTRFTRKTLDQSRGKGNCRQSDLVFRPPEWSLVSEMRFLTSRKPKFFHDFAATWKLYKKIYLFRIVLSRYCNDNWLSSFALFFNTLIVKIHILNIFTFYCYN